MKRCTACFHYTLGQPSYCTHCGRSYDVKICARGHVNPRGVQYCAECGTGDLSTPAPPATLLFRISEWTLRLALVTFVVIVAMSIVLGLIYSVDWSQIGPHLLALLIMLGILYWTTTLLPGPVKHVGKSVGRQAWKRMTKHEKRK